jgi:hypothetical protein
MTVGTGMGAHPAAELLNSAAELARKAGVDPEQRPRRNAHWKLIRNGLKTDPEHGDEPDRGP